MAVAVWCGEQDFCWRARRIKSLNSVEVRPLVFRVLDLLFQELSVGGVVRGSDQREDSKVGTSGKVPANYTAPGDIFLEV